MRNIHYFTTQGGFIKWPHTMEQTCCGNKREHSLYGQIEDRHSLCGQITIYYDQ